MVYLDLPQGKANKSMDGFCAAEKTLTLCKENSELFINEFLWV